MILSLTVYMNLMISVTVHIGSHFYLKYIHCCDAGAVMSVLSSELVPLAD